MSKYLSLSKGDKRIVKFSLEITRNILKLLNSPSTPFDITPVFTDAKCVVSRIGDILDAIYYWELKDHE